MSSEPFKELTDSDIWEMARQAEQVRLDPGHRKPNKWHLRREAIKLAMVPLPELSLDELVWHFREAAGRAAG
jgi:hypothetical protein